MSVIAAHNADDKVGKLMFCCVKAKVYLQWLSSQEAQLDVSVQGRRS